MFKKSKWFKDFDSYWFKTRNRLNDKFKHNDGSTLLSHTLWEEIYETQKHAILLNYEPVLMTEFEGHPHITFVAIPRDLDMLLDYT